VGDLAYGATATLSLQATVAESGPYTTGAAITASSRPDPYLDNNSAAIVTLVTNPAPIISALRVTSITNQSVTLEWDTDQLAASNLIYRLSTDTNELATETDGVLRLQHAVTANGLIPNTDYVLKGRSGTSYGRSTDTIWLTIRTRR
jgi:hypothetical protein